MHNPGMLPEIETLSPTEWNFHNAGYANRKTSEQKVLLVEDEALVRKVTQLILKSAGFDVVTANTAASAITLLSNRECDFDLLVSDVVLPDADGRSLAQRIRVRHPFLPTLFISGYTLDRNSDHEDWESCEFLPKPFSREQLLEKVRLLLTYRPAEWVAISGIELPSR